MSIARVHLPYRGFFLVQPRRQSPRTKPQATLAAPRTQCAPGARLHSGIANSLNASPPKHLPIPTAAGALFIFYSPVWLQRTTTKISPTSQTGTARPAPISYIYIFAFQPRPSIARTSPAHLLVCASNRGVQSSVQLAIILPTDGSL